MRLVLACLCPFIAVSGLAAVEEDGDRAAHMHVEIRGRLEELHFAYGRNESSYALFIEGTAGKNRWFGLDLMDPAIQETAKALTGKTVVITGSDFRAAEVGDGKRRETRWIQLFVTVGKITPVVPASP